MTHAIFDTYGAPIFFLIFLILFFLETKFQLRKRTQSRWQRLLINFIVSIPAFLLLRLMFIPAMVWLALLNESWQFGLSYWISWPVIPTGVLVFLLLDYSLYLWHILLHRLPVLWRFHLVHHTDLDLDLTTAFRFHFGEMIGSLIFRGAVVLLTGASPLIVLIYEIVFEAATQFHHSNMRLPVRLERFLNYFIVTPRMHGIHHSMLKKETDSNYATIFTIWDRLHRTLYLNKPQEDVIIGVPAFADEKEMTIGMLLQLPFTRRSAKREKHFKS